MIDDIVIDLWPFWNFKSTGDIKRKWNPIMDLSKFTSNKEILSRLVALTKLVAKFYPTQNIK